MRSPYTEQLDKFSESELREIAHIKRFLECYSGDADFRDEVSKGERPLSEIALDRGCVLEDLESLRPVFDADYTQFRADATLETWPLTARWDKHFLSLRSSLPFYAAVGDSGGEYPEFDSWRRRQVVRTLLDVGAMAHSIIHPPVAFELSDGCSVGCWFCGISAKKFGGHFSLEDGGAQFWRETVEAAQSVIGRGMATSFLYWATEPLDHPQYIEFVEIFQDVVGVSPQTTTAIPLRDVDRTRAVIENWKTSRFFPNRFSVLTQQILRRIHKEFTPEELVGVELVLQNPESLTGKQTAGRAVDRDALPEKRKKEQLQDGTIACVTGFLVNMPNKTVRLVSPTMATAEVPDGYYVFSEDTFESPKELAEKMRQMINHESSRVIGSKQPLGINSRFWFEEDQTGSFRFRHDNLGFGMELFKSVGPMLQQGKSSPNEIAKTAIKAGHDPILTIKVLDDLISTGLVGGILRPESKSDAQLPA